MTQLPEGRAEDYTRGISYKDIGYGYDWTAHDRKQKVIDLEAQFLVYDVGILLVLLSAHPHLNQPSVSGLFSHL